jgi:uncharacterized protein (TIGR00251 family)
LVADDDLPWVRERGNDVTLRVHVQPGGRVNEILGLHGERLKVRIAAPAVDGRANAALAAFIAECFGVPKRAVVIESGEHSRDKQLTIHAPRDRPDREWARRFIGPRQE